MKGEEKGPKDRYSIQAKTSDEYWLCECGIARSTADVIQDHLENSGHIAELVTQDGDVIGLMARGFEHSKYAGGPPDSAVIQREKMKNEPLFPR